MSDDAATIDSADANGTKADYLTFFIAGEEYGVPILRVREILELDALTRVPGAPPCVRGVINLRGSVVPVADLAIQFHQPECVVTKRTCVVVVEIVLEGALTVIGLMVDAVNQTIELAQEAIEPAPAFGTLARTDYLRGMGAVGKKFVLLLDIDRVLSPEELHQANSLPPPAMDEGESDGEQAAEARASHVDG